MDPLKPQTSIVFVRLSGRLGGSPHPDLEIRPLDGDYGGLTAVEYQLLAEFSTDRVDPERFWVFSASPPSTETCY